MVGLFNSVFLHLTHHPPDQPLAGVYAARKAMNGYGLQFIRSKNGWQVMKPLFGLRRPLINDVFAKAVDRNLMAS